MLSVRELLLLLGFALAATVLIELVAAVVLFRVRQGRELLVVALAQVVTNPLVELLCLVIEWYPGMGLNCWPWWVMIAAELAAAVVEALLYRTARVSSHPWLMSAVLNAISFGLGIVLL